MRSTQETSRIEDFPPETCRIIWAYATHVCLTNTQKDVSWMAVCRSCAGDRPADPVWSYQGTIIIHPEVLVACRLRSEAGPKNKLIYNSERRSKDSNANRQVKGHIFCLTLGVMSQPMRHVLGIKDVRKKKKTQVIVTLDMNTISPYLIVSQGGVIKWTEQRQNLPDTPERFDEHPCVLGNMIQTMIKCYWEVQVGSKRFWELGVTKSTCRKGQLPLRPKQGFWVLRYDNRELKALTDTETPLKSIRIPKRVGLYLNYRKTKVTFFNAQDGSKIYTFRDVEGTVCPFFCPGRNDQEPLIILSIAPNPTEDVSQKIKKDVKRTRKEEVIVTLDMNTISPYLIVSQGGVMKWTEQRQNFPDTPERFDEHPCVLGNMIQTMIKCYWEVQVGSKRFWELGVTKSTCRKGQLPLRPKQGFWVLRCDNRELKALTDTETPLKSIRIPKRVGLYLNYRKTKVTFFNAQDGSKIYTFRDVEGTVCPFFCPGRNDQEPLIILSIAPNPTEEKKEEEHPADDFKRIQQFEVDVTLDLDTINPYLSVSEDGRELRWTGKCKDLYDNPERFDEEPYVLGNVGETRWGCYWEVEAGRKKFWELGIAHDSVPRKGMIKLSPGTGFWVLRLWKGNELKAVTDPETILNPKTIPSRVGVYLDYKKMQVSFYNAEDGSCIYTFQEKFDKTLSPSVSAEAMEVRWFRETLSDLIYVYKDWKETEDSKYKGRVNLFHEQLGQGNVSLFLRYIRITDAVVYEGSDIVLPCQLSPSVSAEAMEVRWFRETLSDLIYVYKDWKETEDSKYKGRVNLFHEQLGQGNVSLFLRDIRIADAGVYTYQFYLVVPLAPLIVHKGSDIVLPCQLSPSISTADMDLRWFRETLTEPIYLYKDGKKTEGSEHKGRVSLFLQELDRGNVSLILRNARISDTDNYLCHISSQHQINLESRLKLEVRSVLKALAAAVAAANSSVNYDVQGSMDITLDLDTINPYLSVSEDGKELRWTGKCQDLYDNPERFDEEPYVLGNVGETRWGCYWEVEAGRKKFWELGIAHDSVPRKGLIILSPGTGFWVLRLWKGNELKALTDPETILNPKTIPSRVGVYLDYKKMQVSFYNAEDGSCIYTFQEKIDKTVRPFFSPGDNDLDPLIISPLPTN
ncbi:uncharacterized protein LOC136768145 [Amia ocellicauda]|uniref:uncharacterized protein LOC136768145 n=1 Tax=Amia ocellicauda TaxID=2972642 RepID=UPI003464CA00